jgi:hypothetical protein
MSFQFQQLFDARTVEPTSFPQPPVLADYHVRVIDGEAKPTSNNQGGYLELTFEILDPGPYLNRKIPDRLNLFNQNPQTCAIAYGHLSAICHVTGVFQIQDIRQLFGIPFIATIGPQKDDPRYSNVYTVKDINGNLPGKTPAVNGVQVAPPAAPQPPVATAPPAWAPPGAATPAPAPAPAWAPPGAQPPATYSPAPAAAPPAWQPPVTTAPPATPVWSPSGAPPAAPPWAR